jgi:CDP-diacylglycerol--glycerol-3-phosphate 3-phosphatidyltransferase
MAGIYAIKPRFQRTLRPIEDWLVERRVHPDRLTLAALAVAAGGGVAIALSPAAPALLLAVPIVAAVRLALNALDGLVARRLGLARPWGEVLNEVGDRLADLALFGGLLLIPGVDARLGAAALAAMLLASYAGIAGKVGGHPVRRPAGRRIACCCCRRRAVALARPGPSLHAVLGLLVVGSLLTTASPRDPTRVRRRTHPMCSTEYFYS